MRNRQPAHLKRDQRNQVGRCPIGVGDDANVKATFLGAINATTQNIVVKKSFTSLKVNPLDGPQGRGFREDMLDGFDCHGAALRRRPPHKAMVALEVTLVGQQEVQLRQWL